MKYRSFEEFESLCSVVSHSFCNCCYKVGINVVVGKKGVCQDCAKYGDVNFLLDKKALPVWYLNGVPQFHIPDELSCLTTAECMLIQLNSPFIPLQHIKNGVFGISGHVVSFEQDVEGFVKSLPRCKNDVSMLNVIKVVKAEIGTSEDCNVSETFRVRKTAVFNALTWLSTYNPEYKDILIDMTALNWMKDEEDVLGSLDIDTENGDTVQDALKNTKTSDLGPNPHLTRVGELSGESIKTFGYVDDTERATISPDDTIIHNHVLNVVDAHSKGKHVTIQWPNCGAVPVSEFTQKRLFARAYPWLFPGGVGDIQDFPKSGSGSNIKEWGKNLIMYRDGRFTKDKFFCFFALNYITRQRNASSGNWFISGFNKGGPQSLEELKKTIEGGDMSFVSRLNYFNRTIKGSTHFWHSKRQELYTWINHHVEMGHGAPDFFITLSCCEHYWVDIIRLIKERMDMAGDDASQCFVGSRKLSQILNDYAIVVQEYFQKRVEIWLKTVGKKVLGIKHYWVRFEFAPGRGQIHAHLLAIRENKTINRLLHLDLSQPDGKTKRDARLAKWARDTFGLTSSVDSGFDERDIEPSNSPCTIRFTDIDKTDEAIRDDGQNLMRFCQTHTCSGFCLKQDKHSG